MLTLLFFRGGEHGEVLLVVAAFRFAGFLISPPSQEVFRLAKFSSSLSLSEDALFSLDETSTLSELSSDESSNLSPLFPT